MSSRLLIMVLTEAAENQPLLRGAPQTCGMRSGRVYLKPGESCGEHSTGDREEQLVFFAGKGIAYSGPEKTPHQVGVGKLLYIPPQTIHNIHNDGNEPLVYIYCVTPVIEEKKNEYA